MKNLNDTINTRIINLFCGGESLKLIFQIVEDDYETNGVSDRHAAVLLVKGEKIENCCDEENKETQIFIIKIPSKIQILSKIKKITKSIIFQRMRNFIYKVVEGVIIKLLIELVLSLIHEKDIAYC